MRWNRGAESWSVGQNTMAMLLMSILLTSDCEMADRERMFMCTEYIKSSRESTDKGVLPAKLDHTYDFTISLSLPPPPLSLYLSISLSLYLSLSLSLSLSFSFSFSLSLSISLSLSQSSAKYSSLIKYLGINMGQIGYRIYWTSQVQYPSTNYIYDQ